MRISDWSSDVCSSDLTGGRAAPAPRPLWPMDYHLLPHVSFGFVDDRAVALDLRNDLYFMIAAAETSVLRSADLEGPGLVDGVGICALVRLRLIGTGPGPAMLPVLSAPHSPPAP